MPAPVAPVLNRPTPAEVDEPVAEELFAGVAEALAGLRANEARYFKNKYDHTFVVEAGAPIPGPADE